MRQRQSAWLLAYPARANGAKDTVSAAQNLARLPALTFADGGSRRM
jgi:hypothetical protein